MEGKMVALVILSIIGSGALGVVISILYYRGHENYLRKLEVLKDFVGWRFTMDVKYIHLGSAQLWVALNQIGVLFKTKEVREPLLELHKRAVAGELTTADNDLLVRLYKGMCNDLNIKVEDFTDQFFLKPFAPKGLERK